MAAKKKATRGRPKGSRNKKASRRYIYGLDKNGVLRYEGRANPGVKAKPKRR